MSTGNEKPRLKKQNKTNNNNNNKTKQTNKQTKHEKTKNKQYFSVLNKKEK
jgi:hypothetical protein